MSKRYDILLKLETELQDAGINYTVYDGAFCGELEFTFPGYDTIVIQTGKLDRYALCDLIADVLKYRYKGNKKKVTIPFRFIDFYNEKKIEK